IESYRRALSIYPRFSEAHVNMGYSQHHLGLLNDAVESFKCALEIDPEHPAAHYTLAETLLLLGDFEAGWREYEWRFRSHQCHSPLPLRRWDGWPLAGQTILLACEQG